MKENSQSQVDFGNPEKLQIYEGSTLYSFVNNEFWIFFELLGIEPTFFSLPICEGQSSNSYCELSNIVSMLKVVNDAAERTVKFGSDYTDAITKNEARRQAILQEVELSRKSYPKSTKQCFIQYYHKKKRQY